MENIEYEKFNLVSIDAWKDPDTGWYWNNFFMVERDIYFSLDNITPRKIAKFLRKMGALTDHSKGRIIVDMSCDECIEIQDKNTREPLFALTQLH